MTLLPTPRVDLAAYRAVVPVPPDVHMIDVWAVCPVDDTVLRHLPPGWYCPVCLAWWDRRGRAGMWLDAERVLAAALASEDDQEATGLLAGDDRRTCHTCRVWASPAHLASSGHWSTIDAAADTVTAAELAEVACPVPVVDGVRGMCWQARPCPDHDAQTVPDSRVANRRRALVAGVVAAVLAVAGGYAVGRWRPWSPLVDADLLTVAAVAATVVLVAVTAAVAVVRRHAIGEAVRRGR